MLYQNTIWQILDIFLAQEEMKKCIHKYTISYSHQKNPFKMSQTRLKKNAIS